MRFLWLPNQTLLPSIVSAILYIFVFGKFLGPRVQPIDGHPYIVFIFPGILMMGTVTAAFQNSTTSLFISRWEHFIDDLLVAPISFTEMVIAFTTASVIRGILNGLVVLPAGLLLLSSNLAHPWLLLLALTVSSVFFSAFGLIVGLWAQRWDNIAVFQNFIITPLTFLGGVFYSTAMLPESFQWINHANPVFYMVCAARYAFLGVSDVPISTSLGVTAALSVVAFTVAVALFRRGYNLRV